MLEPAVILQACAAAAALAAAIVSLYRWVPHHRNVAWQNASAVLGVALGFYLGCWQLGVRPNWPPREDVDRLLFLLIPAATFLEIVAAFLADRSWLVWTLRLALAVGAGPLLLHDTVYLSDAAGPGTRAWTPAEMWLLLGGLAVALGAVWAALSWPTRHGAGRTLSFSLALTCGATSIVVMLSGYASGGLIGLPFAAAVAGGTLATWVQRRPPQLQGVTGFAVVGLFALVLIGRFFGELSTVNALLLFFAPLACCLAQIPFVRRVAGRWHGPLGVALTCIPVAFALTLATHRIAENSVAPSPGSQEPTLQDYLDFGKK